MFDLVNLERQRTDEIRRLLADSVDEAKALRAGLEQALVSLLDLAGADFREGRLATIIQGVETALLMAGARPTKPRKEPDSAQPETLSIPEAVALLKDAIDRANTSEGPHPFLFDTLSLRDAQRIWGACVDTGLVDDPRGSTLPRKENE